LILSKVVSARRVAAVAALGLLLLPALALGQSSRDFKQSPELLARFPDVPIALDTPGLKPGKTGFTSQEEMIAYVDGVAARNPAVVRGSLGKSGQGRDLPYLVFTAEGGLDLAAAGRLNRPVVWLIGQQHGNEPAGGEAMLALSRALAEGELKPLLNRVTVVVVPRANPDGAAAFKRQTASGEDLNRNHLVSTEPEARALQAGMAQLPPDVVIDAHEYGVTGGWDRRHGAVAPWDATLMRTTHVAASPALVALDDKRFGPAIERRLKAAGLRSGVYLAGFDSEDHPQTGGTAPGIARNYFGLMGSVSFLIETRGIGAGRDAFQRRVATHYLASSEVLRTAAKEGGKLRKTVREARRRQAAATGPILLGQELGLTPAKLVLFDAQTGADKPPLAVQIRDARRLTPGLTRPRPLGYLVALSAKPVVDSFKARGLRICRVISADTLPVEAFRVTRLEDGDAQATAINPRPTVKAELEPDRIVTGRGWYWVPMAQPGAPIVAAALEADAPGSLIDRDVLHVPSGGTAPIYRVLPGAKAPHLEPDC
jgi:hypothetical protein